MKVETLLPHAVTIVLAGIKKLENLTLPLWAMTFAGQMAREGAGPAFLCPRASGKNCASRDRTRTSLLIHQTFLKPRRFQASNLGSL